MIEWRNDVNQSVQDTSDHGRIKFKSPVDANFGVRQVIARNANLDALAISFGDFNPWAGDWCEVIGSDVHERRLAAPTSVHWVTHNNMVMTDYNYLKDLLSIYRKQVASLDKIRAGQLYKGAVGEGNEMTIADLWRTDTASDANFPYMTVYDATQDNADIGPFAPFPQLMVVIESSLPGMDNMYNYQGDRASIKITSSPFGGDTHGQLAAVHALLQEESSSTTNSAMPMHNYTEVKSTPTWGSTDTFSAAGGLNVCDNIYAWYPDSDWTGGDATSSSVDTCKIVAPDVALDAWAAGLEEADDWTFPLFVNKNISGETLPNSDYMGRLSYYQPHLLTGGDGYSSKIVAANGSFQGPNGFMSAGKLSDLSVCSAGMQLALPDVDAKHTFWADGMKIGYTGSYGIEDGDRTWHNAVNEVLPSIAAHYRSIKTAGDGAFSIGMVGYGYNAVPVTPSDWPVITFHANPKLKHCFGTVYSVGHSVFDEGSKIGIETLCFTQPYMSFQWEDIAGTGATYEYPVDLKGYRYKFANTGLATPKAARVDSRKAQGGFKPASLFAIPLVREKIKLWESTVDTYGVQTTTGRFDALSANDTGMTETTGGALFTQRPDLSANLYTTWTAETETQVIGRFTVKVI